MKKFILIFLLSLSALKADISGFYLGEPNEAGVKAVIEIFKYKQSYFAFGFANDDLSKAGKDSKNPKKALRARSLRGVIFVWDLKKTAPTHYEGGRIYNVNTGKSYDLSIDEEKDFLKLRASFLFFGKDLRWERLKDMQKYEKYKLDYKDLLKQLESLRKND